MSAATVLRCICGAASRTPQCPDFPNCLPAPAAPQFTDVASDLYADVSAIHALVLRSVAHGGHDQRARAKMLRALSDVKAAARDAGVRR